MNQQKTEEMEQTLGEAIKPFLFESSTPETYGNIVEAYSDLLSKESGVIDYSVVCDESINPEEEAKAGFLNVDVSVKFDGDDGFTLFPIRVSPSL